MLGIGSTSAWADVKPFSESYSSTSTTTGWSTGTSGRFTPTILNESDNYFLSVAQDSRNNNGATVTGTIISGKAAAGDDFTITFDMRLSSSTNQTNTEFIIKDAANSGNFFSLKETGTWATTWIINGTSTQVTLPNSNKGGGSNTIADVTWCSYKVTRYGSKTYLTITNKETSGVIFAQAAVSGSSSDGGLGNIVFVSSRYLANFAIDNIVVREVLAEDIPSTYTATFTNTTSGNHPSVTIYTDSERSSEIANGSLEDGETYYYTATETNYYNYQGSFTVDGADPAVNFSMTLKPAYTINAVSGSTTLTTFASGRAGEGDAYGAYVSKAVLYNGQYYLLDDGSNANLSDYYASYTMGNGGDEVKEINYTLDESVKAFWEGESMSNVGHSVFNTRSNLSAASGGKAITPYSGTENGIKTNSTIGVGVYNIVIKPNYWDDSSTEYKLQYSTDNSAWNDIETVSFAKNSNDEYVADNIQILSSSYLRLMSPGGTPRHSIDYILAEKVGEVVGLIGLNGNWAEDILMTHSEGYVFTTTVENFAAKAGVNYEYKIRDYGTWDSFQFPVTGLGNKSFSVAEDGIYTLTFTANISTGAVTVEKTRTSAYANVVTLVNVAGWDKDNVYAYAWTGEEKNATWPGLKIEKVGTYQGYDVFAYSYATKHDNIIFSENGSDSKKTSDLTFTDAEQYSNGTILPYYSVTYTNPDEWSNVYAYTWTTKGGSDKNADWPGIAMTPTENGYVYGVHAESAPTKVVFNDNGSNQTDNLKFYDGLTYSFGAKGSTVPVTISSAGYATYASAATLNFAESGITAYSAEETDGKVTFSEQSWVPAGTGLLLKAEPGTYDIPTATSLDEDYAVSSALIGVVKTTTIEDAGIFVLMNGASGVGFYKTTSAFTVGANTAYFAALPTTARFFSIDEVGTTSISEQFLDEPSGKAERTVNSEKFATAPVYNLQGQRVAQPRKGLYIVNGKKVIKN